ncbi:MAG: Pseudouridine-5'-phosphate glycosidase [Alphaproteobacteria bacterium MarineAlpha5_Bin9]|nr:MAG: Pseudouridine-5'-phosphate glycosidase [Alphaproteobacteria bacterium MarineAlpha5_Bin9]|tara:strand:- start:10842 stop:11756 length:915 start_codon:yes stop_codon:yes gene_type:complete
MIKDKIFINDEIKTAIFEKKPIVALESTLISHGFPYPQNIEVALSSIKAVRKAGAIPATIGIMKGKIKIGLLNKDIEIFAKSKNVKKVSNHNFLISLKNNETASTTVGSSIMIASMFKIKFFSTGGIGGVHRNFETTGDISNDLISLSKNSTFVICSGPKSILDIDRTFELLETLGIPRIGYNTKFMPGFWFSKTNKILDYNFKKNNELISYLKLHDHIQKNNSVLIFNPVPKNKSLKKIQVENWINKSLEVCLKKNISGKEVTPFLIKEINRLSNNASLKANSSLIINNAYLAGKLAKKFYSN